MRNDKPKSIDVIWEDAWHSDGVWAIKELKERGPFLVRCSGFLIYEDKNNLVIASEYRIDREDSWRHVQSIPKSLIRQRR